MDIRPPEFTLNPFAAEAAGLQFAGLGRVAKTYHYADSSRHGNYGELVGMDPATEWVYVPELGRWGVANDYSGSKSVTISGHNILTNNEHTFSVAGWVRINSQHHGCCISKTECWWVGPRKYVDRWAAGTTESDGTYAYTYDGNNTLPVDTWKHFVCCWDGDAGAITLYVDGSDSAVDLTTTGWDGTVRNNSSDITLLYSVFGSTRLDGVLADPLIYNRLLSATERSELADPSNVMLSGLLEPHSTRKLFPAAVVTGTPQPTSPKVPIALMMRVS